LTSFKTALFYKGDKAKIYTGAYKNLRAVIVSVEGPIAKFRPKGTGAGKEEVWEDKIENFIKLFAEGDHVKVVSGLYEGTTGQVISYKDDVVKLLTDNNNEITVKPNDLTISEHKNF